MKKKKYRGVEALKSRYGRMFVLHWEIGMVLFFFVPMVSSIIYSFSTVSVTPKGVKTVFEGFKHYRVLFLEDPRFVENLRAALFELCTSLPLILVLSLIIAIILNQKFGGRLLARAIFFMPVIIATGVVMNVMTSNYIGVSLVTSSTGALENQVYGTMIDFNGILMQLGMPDEMTTILSTYIGNIFNLIWSCGIQIVLFIAGLQTIPEQLYEVSKVEGSTKWEEFWFITLPLLSHVLILVVIFTMIDLFTSKNNIVMRHAYELLQDQQIYDKSSAILWIYFVLVGLVIGTVHSLYTKVCLKRWE